MSQSQSVQVYIQTHPTIAVMPSNTHADKAHCARHHAISLITITQYFFLSLPFSVALRLLRPYTRLGLGAQDIFYKTLEL